MTLTLRYMQTDDIKQVTAIDNLSFDPPWPTNSYRFEINQSTVSHMVVLEQSQSLQTYTNSSQSSRITRFLDTVLGRNGATQSNMTIVGYGGLWKVADEAHISTIAVHPDFRGHHYGEILLAGMYGKALLLDADYMVLEVRMSNRVAQNLYRKYGFTEYDIKKNYYRSNKEDAYDMRVTFDKDLINTFNTLYDSLQKKCSFLDQYSECPHPRRG